MLRTAVVGTGKISEEHLRFLQGSALAEVAAVVDLSPAMSRFAADRFCAGAAYSDFGAMMEEVKPDVVHVLTPPATHREIVSRALNGGAHVLVEKPIALRHGEFLELWELARSRRLHLMEDQNYRFNRPVLEIDRLREEGCLGEVREVEVRMVLGIRKGGRYADPNLPHPSHRLPAGVLHEFLSHLVYLALAYMPEPERVTARWSNHGGGDLFRFDDLDALLLAGPVHGRLRFTCHTAPDEFTLRVRGTRGWAEADLFQPFVRVVVPRGGDKLAGVANHLVNGWREVKAGLRGFVDKVAQRTPYEGLHRLLGRTYEAFTEGKELPVGFREMDRTLRLIDRLLAEGERP